MIKNILSDKEFNSFQENGFLIKENFFKNQEINKINNTLKKDHNFNNFYNNVGYPISLSRGAYWLGLSYEKLGDKELSYQFTRS